MTEQYVKFELNMGNVVDYWKKNNLLNGYIDAYKSLKNDSQSLTEAIHSANTDNRDESTPAFFVNDDVLYCKYYANDNEGIEQGREYLMNAFINMISCAYYWLLEEQKGEDAAEDWDCDESEIWFDLAEGKTPLTLVTTETTTDDSELYTKPDDSSNTDWQKDDDGKFQYLEELY